MMRIFLAAIILTNAVIAVRAAEPKQTKLQRIRLANGANVILLHTSKVESLGIEAFYEVGFIHEPAGMLQSAHLLEHLICMGATESFAQGESWELLNRDGRANAETLADWTHFDYMVPNRQLEAVLQIEAERQTSLKFDEALVRAEANRCYEEFRVVEQNPATGMLKYGLMALCQAWRHGATEVSLHSGLEDMPVEALARFHQSAYRPDRLTLLIVGDFHSEKAIPAILKRIGSIPATKVQAEPLIDWDNLPKRQRIAWDSSTRAVCLAFPPPTSRADRVLLSLYGSLVANHLATDDGLKSVAQMTFCSQQQWPVGELPFFVYATAQPGHTLDELETTLTTQFFEAVQETREALYALPTLITESWAQACAPKRFSLQRQAMILRFQELAKPHDAMGLVLGQMALNLGTLNRLLGPQADQTLSSLRQQMREHSRSVITRHLNPKRMFVTLINSRTAEKQPPKQSEDADP